MREAIAILLIVLVLAGILGAWRYAVTARRRESHSVRYRLVAPNSNDRVP